VTIVRMLFLPAIALVLGLTINEMLTRLQAQNDAVMVLRRKQEQMLDAARHDAMELARISSQLRATRNLFSGVIDAATEQAIIGTDSLGTVDVFNPGAEGLLGYAREAVVGRMRVTDWHVPAELDARREELFGDTSRVDDPGSGLQALVAPALRGQTDVRDWTYVRADGSPVTVRVAITRREPQGGGEGYVFVATDVTAERETARLKDEFVSLVSHELRTPLSSILGYLELLQDDEETLSDEQSAYLAVIERNAHRLLRLVGDLLLTAQVDAGRFVVSRQPTDVVALVRAAVLTAEPAAQAARVRLELRAPERLETDVDPLRVGQAVDNLLANAVKFTPADGTVTVDVREGDLDGRAGVLVTVSDTGIGIPPDELDRLATRFFRASTATRRAIPGVGLGLTITAAIAEAHGGALQIASTVGEGSRFTLALPR